MTTKPPNRLIEAASDPSGKNFLRCAMRIIVVPSVPVSEIDRIAGLLERECPQGFRERLAEYLCEHYLEELVVPGRQQLDSALEQIATAFAMLDEADRCGPTVPLLWIDVSESRNCHGRRLQ